MSLRGSGCPEEWGEAVARDGEVLPSGVAGVIRGLSVAHHRTPGRCGSYDRSRLQKLLELLLLLKLELGVAELLWDEILEEELLCEELLIEEVLCDELLCEELLSEELLEELGRMELLHEPLLWEELLCEELL